MAPDNLVINNLLCFVESARDSLPSNDIISICHAFYKANDIKEAKDLIYKVIGQHSVRRRTDDKIKVELQDILEAFRKSDEEEVQLPRFVASGFNAMPPSTGFEVVSDIVTNLLDEITCLREEIKSMKESRVAEIRNLEDYIDIKEELSDIKKILLSNRLPETKPKSSSQLSNLNSTPLDHGATAFVTHEIKKSYASAASVGVSSASSPRNLNATSRPSGEGSTPPEGDPSREEGVSGRLSARGNGETGREDQQQNVSEWKTQKKRNRRENIIGRKKGTSLGLRSAPRTGDVYVGGCDLEVTSQDIVNYCKTELSIDIINCTELESKSSFRKAFKIKLNFDDRDKILSPDFWPENIVIRKFYNPRTTLSK